MGSKNSSSDATSQIDEEWKKRLTPEQYHVCREKGTERPFTGIYNDHFEQGTYLCVCCDAELFESDTKFNSHCGWPAFSAAKKVESKPDGNVARNVDMSHGMIRTEVTCAKCGAHLGHVFDDGPTPTGERFCINSISLKFQKPKN